MFFLQVPALEADDDESMEPDDEIPPPPVFFTGTCIGWRRKHGTRRWDTSSSSPDGNGSTVHGILKRVPQLVHCNQRRWWCKGNEVLCVCVCVIFLLYFFVFVVLALSLSCSYLSPKSSFSLAVLAIFILNLRFLTFFPRALPLLLFEWSSFVLRNMHPRQWQQGGLIGAPGVQQTWFCI